MSKVAIIRCESYDLDEVYNALKKGVNLLGGINNFFSKDELVLIKPNLLAANSKDKCATTDPAVFEAVIKLMIENKFKITYGDSPAYGNPEKVASVCGIKQVGDKYELPFADFVNGELTHFSDGVRSKQFDIAKGVLEADAILNVCKMKSHALTRITGAIKNTFGCVVGFNKGLMHAKFSNAYDFSEMLIDLNRLLKPRLHIMDGIMAMEGNGPRSGDPVKMNVLLISDDPVALDAVFCRLVDLNPKIIPPIVFGEKYGIGSYNDIELVGDDIQSLINHNFNIPKNEIKKEDIKTLPILRKFILRRPYIVKDKCIKCGICVEACPITPKAIYFNDDNKVNPPIYDYNKCIRCFCCQEMCPKKAIEVKIPFLGKIVYRIQK